MPGVFVRSGRWNLCFGRRWTESGSTDVYETGRQEQRKDRWKLGRERSGRMLEMGRNRYLQARCGPLRGEFRGCQSRFDDRNTAGSP